MAEDSVDEHLLLLDWSISECARATFCVTLSVAFPAEPMLMTAGLLMYFLASLSTGGGIVAENM